MNREQKRKEKTRQERKEKTRQEKNRKEKKKALKSDSEGHVPIDSLYIALQFVMLLLLFHFLNIRKF